MRNVKELITAVSAAVDELPDSIYHHRLPVFELEEYDNEYEYLSEAEYFRLINSWQDKDYVFQAAYKAALEVKEIKSLSF